MRRYAMHRIKAERHSWKQDAFFLQELRGDLCGDMRATRSGKNPKVAKNARIIYELDSVKRKSCDSQVNFATRILFSSQRIIS